MKHTGRLVVGSYLTVAILLLTFAAPAATFTGSHIPMTEGGVLETPTVEEPPEIAVHEPEEVQEDTTTGLVVEEKQITVDDPPPQGETETNDPLPFGTLPDSLSIAEPEPRTVQVDIFDRKGIGHHAIKKPVGQEEQAIEKGETKYDMNCGELSNFSDKDEMEDYIVVTRQDVQEDLYWVWTMLGIPTLPGMGLVLADQGNDVPDYSGTNNQVAGVDEPDIVKTDGFFIYAISGEDVVIMRAYPVAHAGVVARIEVGKGASEIFVKDNRLVVFQRILYDEHVKIYNIADRTNPVLIQTVSFEKSFYLDSRLIEDHVYMVVRRSVRIDKDEGLQLPKITNDGNTTEVKPGEVCHFDEPAPDYVFTTVVSIDLVDKEVRYKTYLIDDASGMYVSTNNLYIYGINYDELIVDPMFGFYWNRSTNVFKISIEDGYISYKNAGKVTGWVLNQFSMDEYKGYFRIATTSGSFWGLGSSVNNLYVLNSKMETIGELEDLAKGETIHSARFMKERCYLVTFKKVDPFFVIDLSNPTAPSVLGLLKIPGYSDYLHPYDENHIIGLGKDTHDMGDFAWYQGVKLSLFDVADVSNPKEMSTYIIGDRGTDSEALHDHKAFLFDRSRNLLIIPIDLYILDDPDAEPYERGEFVWQGAYVFSVTLDDGFVLKGKVSHSDHLPDLKNNYYKYRSYYVRRSLYIDINIYTISGEMVKINNMETLDGIKVIDL